MPDMLVRLYDLDAYGDGSDRLKKEAIEIRTAMAPNLTLLREWIAEHFNGEWADEATKAILASPPGCFVAVRGSKILGFACYDATAKGFFGPTGVEPDARGKGIGQALLLHSLKRMAAAGYAYAVIGSVGPAEFYKRCCGATVIEGSDPGYYRNLMPPVAK